MKHFCLFLQCTLIVTVAGCGINEFKQREQTMAPLLSTNASLQVVEATLHERFSIERRGSAEWTNTLTHYRAYAIPNYKRIAAKINNSEAYGHSSSISMQTWVFLDKEDRLIGFEVDSQ